ncbi:MAG TPA: hypothetical protein VHS99_19310 [Chloroflexota bacterium]|nr:hypothetical protein [Chloroflexota bacterium]
MGAESAQRGHSPSSSAARGPARGLWLAGAVVCLLYVAVMVRGLAWQWEEILNAAPPQGVLLPAPGSITAPADQGTGQPAPAAMAPVAPPAAPGGARAATPAAGTPRQALAPTDAPPPRDAVDEHGVYYDAEGIAVMGIEADSSGVYNVPPGRQVRIGGANGELFDVLPGGRLSPAPSR